MPGLPDLQQDIICTVVRSQLTSVCVVAGLDADMLALVVHADRETAPEVCRSTTIAAAFPWAFEQTTGRPLVAVTIVCQVFQLLQQDLQVLTHELFHALVRALMLRVPYPYERLN
jgi:hypothetical protein